MKAKLPTAYNLAYFFLVGGICPKCWVKPVEENMRGLYCDPCWGKIVGLNANTPKMQEWQRVTDAWEAVLFYERRK
jgi:hypothetical protein